MIRLRLNFRGTVQGVGFRATAESIARRHAVAGWVRNDPDGSVTLEVEGEEPEVRAFLDALDERLGRLVRERDETPIEPTGERGFLIRRGQ